MARLIEIAAPIRAVEVECPCRMLHCTGADQCDADPLRGRRTRLSPLDDAGPCSIRGARAAEGGLPADSEPRAARSARVDQARGTERARGLVGRVPREAPRVLRLIDGQANRMRRLNPDPPDSGSIQAAALTVAPESTSWVLLVDPVRPTFLSGGGHPVLVELPPGCGPCSANGSVSREAQASDWRSRRGKGVKSDSPNS